jgi:hypothetical protein
MKIGPFTPPDVREAILWDQEHSQELPVVMLPEMYLSIAGFTIHIAAHEGVQLNFVDERILAPFVVAPMDAPDFTMIAQRVAEQFEIPEGTLGNVIGELGPESWWIQTHHWRLDWNKSKPTLILCKYFSSSSESLGALRLFLAHQLLAQGRGLLLHAAAAVHDGRTFVFLGHSGAGKSTSAYNSPGQILSDEIVALVSNPYRRLVAQGTPFGGEHFPSATPGPSPEFLFVEKSDHNARKKLSTRNAVARLLSQVVLFPFAPLDLWDRAAEMVERILENHPVEVLEARKDGSFWKELLS